MKDREVKENLCHVSIRKRSKLVDVVTNSVAGFTGSLSGRDGLLWWWGWVLYPLVTN